MIEKSKINETFRESILVDEEGVKEVKTFSIQEVQNLGVVDVSAFLSGMLDAENDNDFNDSSEDYIKGYRYGKTGSF